MVLMNSVWSSENYEKPSDEILELGKRVLAHAGIPTSAGMQVKKWRYANLSSAFPARRYSVTSVPIPLPTGGQASLPLLFASDGFSSDLRGTAELDPQLGVQRATMSGVGVGRVVAGMLGLGR